jgi:hypothetical protein
MEYERSSMIIHQSRSTGWGSQGGWQKFERGQIPLFPLYEQFSQELSDVDNGNKWYIEYCEKKKIGEPWNHSPQTPIRFYSDNSMSGASAEVAHRRPGSEHSPTFDAQILNNVAAFRSHDENRPEAGQVCL